MRPYFALRSYTDGGEHYEGQVGGEGTPREYIDALLECTREWVRVLKPSGSIFVNLGDKYGQSAAQWGGSRRGHQGVLAGTSADHATRFGVALAAGAPEMGKPKSLMLLPERYRIACVDELGLIARAVIVWSKPNGLPESVTDRVRRSHEDWVHLTRLSRYYSAIDEIREPSTPQPGLAGTFKRPRPSHDLVPGQAATQHRTDRPDEPAYNPLGKLPGSVWEIPTEPLAIPEHVSHARCCGGVKRDGCTDGLEHFAAYPTEWPRRIILGWSPSGICLECGEGRRPLVHKPGLLGGDNNPESRSKARRFSTLDGGQKNWDQRMAHPDRIVGSVCACTPFTDHPERRRPSVTPGRNLARGTQEERAAITGSRRHGSVWPQRESTRDYELAGWIPPPTRPAVVLDPFGGTGTTALVASVLGRIGISVDLSADYCRLARWRVNDPGERAKALRVPKPEPVAEAQLGLFEVGGR